MYSKGISWINDCRIPFVDENIDFNSTQKGKVYGRNSLNESITERNTTHYNNEGRFPANILVSDDMLNDGIVNGGGSYSGIKQRKRNRHFKERGQNYGSAESPDNYGDKGSNSRYYNIDKWFENLIK